GKDRSRSESLVEPPGRFRSNIGVRPLSSVVPDSRRPSVSAFSLSLGAGADGKRGSTRAASVPIDGGLSGSSTARYRTLARGAPSVGSGAPVVSLANHGPRAGDERPSEDGAGESVAIRRPSRRRWGRSSGRSGR